MQATDAVLSVRTVLATKITPPRPRRQLVGRRRLRERLRLAAAGPLTLVTAPAGFGKTTLLSAWQSQCEIPACWLTLDERDNDLARFWRYVVAALRRQQPGIGGLLLTDPSMSADQIELGVTALVNDLAATKAEIVLVLDDYHAITLPAIHESLAFFIEQQPPQMHLIIASRTTPSLPLARLRARAALTELQSSDLRFTPAEASVFLRDTMALDLTNTQVATLAAQTEGWIAGLHLAALSLRECHDVAAFIAAFAGNHRYIFDYLAEEVLRRQPEEIRRFLMQSSILERLQADLCAAVTDEAESKHILEHIEQANLFIVALDDERCWYRYHALFADFLRAQLQQHDPDQIPVLHSRASVWYECQGQMTEAIEHALAARDFAHAAALLERVSEALFKRGECMTLLGWLGALPSDIIARRPQLGFFYAGVLVSVGQLDDAERQLQTVEGHLAYEKAASAMDDSAMQLWRSEISATRAIIAAYRGDVPRMLDLRQQSLADLPDDNAFIRSLLAAGKAAGFYWSGDVITADREIANVLTISRRAGNIHTEIASLCIQGFVRAMQGRLRESAAVFHQVIALSAAGTGQVSPILALAYIGLGELQYEWNEMDTAIRTFQQGFATGQAWGDLRSLAYGYLMLARVTFFCQGIIPAMAIIDEVEQQARQQHINDVIGWSATTRAWLLIAQGDLAAATHWMQVAAREQNAMLGIPYQCMVITQARLHIACSEPELALHILAETTAAAQSGGALRSVVEMTMLRALAQQARDDTTAALNALAAALALAEPEGYVRVFVDVGPPLIALLDTLSHAPTIFAAHGVTADYIARLLTVAGCRPAVIAAANALNERELAVLYGLAAGKSNAALAQEMIVAETTVKWHIKHLYRKLDVHSRTQAIARARALGMLA